MEALGHKEYNVVGWSDGSIAAVLLAAKQKKAVGKLVIFGGNAFFTQEDVDAYEATRDIEKTWSKRMKATHLPVYGNELPLALPLPLALALAPVVPLTLALALALTR